MISASDAYLMANGLVTVEDILTVANNYVTTVAKTKNTRCGFGIDEKCDEITVMIAMQELRDLGYNADYVRFRDSYYVDLDWGRTNMSILQENEEARL